MKIVLHAVFWLLIWLWMTSVYLYNEDDFLPYLLFNLSRLPVIAAATYAISYFVVRRQLAIAPPNYMRAAVTFILIFVLATFADRIVSGFKWLEPTLNGEPLYYQFINPMPMAKNGFLLFSILGLGAAIQFFYSIHTQQQQIHMLQEEKLESELAFLKNQINPHFLFNSFNNLYSLAERNGNDDLAKGLAGMAGLMRYLTYESNVPKVQLEKEVSLLQSFIELQKIRISEDDDVFISFRTEGDFSNHRIAPVLLLPLVENAFKHNVSPDHATWIDIFLKAGNNQLLFEVRNKCSAQAAREAGIGLQNLRKRLSLIYPDKHKLHIEQDEDVFKVSLNIDTFV